MNPRSALPEQTGCERDADGRLVGIVFDSTPPTAPAHATPFLIAVDGSANALRAVTHAANSMPAAQAGTLHLVNVQPWLSREAAESELAQRGLEATREARMLLDARHLPWRLHIVMGSTPARCILEQATRSGATGIAIGRRGLNTIEGLLFGSVTWKILQLAAIPVTVVP